MTSTLLLATVAFVYAANNLGVIRSAYAGVSRRGVLIYTSIALTGFSTGFLLEGYKVGSSLLPSLAEVGGSASDAILAVTLAILAAFTLLKLPASISNVSVGAVVGVALSRGVPVNIGGLLRIMGIWLLAPLVSATLATVIYLLYRKAVSTLPLAPVSQVGRLLGIAAIFSSSYVLAANNLGILVAFGGGVVDLVSVIASALLRAALLSELVAWTLGWRVAQLSPTGYATSLLAGSATLWACTQLGVPTSLSQCAVASMMALSLGRRPVIINSGAVFEVLGSWPLFLGISALLGFGVGSLALRF